MLKYGDGGQVFSDGNRTYSKLGRLRAKPTSSHHFIDDPLPIPSTSQLENSAHPRPPRRNSDSDSSSSVDTRPMPTWKYQTQSKASYRKIKKQKTVKESSGHVEIQDDVWHSATKPITDRLRKFSRQKTVSIQPSDSESSSSDSDFVKKWKPHLKSATTRKESKNNESRQISKPPTKRTTSFRYKLKVNTNGRNDTDELANQSTSHQISDFHPESTSIASHLGVGVQFIDKQHKYSILKKNKHALPRSTSAASKDKPTPPVPEKKKPIVNKQDKRNKSTAVLSAVRKSPRKKSNICVSNAKNGMRSDTLPSCKRRATPRGPQQRRQLLQSNSQTVEEENDNNEDGSEQHSPLVRGKTRSRTRYYSTVGAVLCPPEPEDYIQWREWPADIGLVYAEYPRDFPEPEPCLPSPKSSKETGADHALHCIIAIVAFTTAANQRGHVLAAHEINLIEFMLGKLAEFVCWETSVQNEETNAESFITSKLYQDIENIQINESVRMESISDSKISFLETFGLNKSVEVIDDILLNPLSTAEEETILTKGVNELIRFIGQVILKQLSEQSRDIEQSLAHSSMQHEEYVIEVLMKFLNRLMLSTSLLYSIVCNVPYEFVKKYIDSQTPEVVTEWMTDILKNTSDIDRPELPHILKNTADT